VQRGNARGLGGGLGGEPGGEPGGGTGGGLDWAGWIVTRRGAIEHALATRLGDARPAADSSDSEALRRFRSWVAASLRRGAANGAPALDGLHVDPARFEPLLDAWCVAAVDVAGANGAELRARLTPLGAQFQAALTGGRLARRAQRAPRTTRRAVPGAIDRIADAFLAVDLDDGRIVDANPAAAELLRAPRETLLGVAALPFVRGPDQATWGDELAELAESDEPRRFRASFVDTRARPVAVEVHATRHVRGRAGPAERVLALIVARVL
jgi:PAS domain-containing protein